MVIVEAGGKGSSKHHMSRFSKAFVFLKIETFQKIMSKPVEFVSRVKFLKIIDAQPTCQIVSKLSRKLIYLRTRRLSIETAHGKCFSSIRPALTTSWRAALKTSIEPRVVDTRKIRANLL